MPLPKDMTGIEIVAAGGPEKLVPVENAVPTPADNEVLIKVAAAGINRPDILQRMGFYPPPPGASPLPGLEVAGEIVAIGKDIDKNRLGQLVCALLPGGGYAEYAVADTRLALPIPGRLSMIEAAALPETYFTVWANVFADAKLQAGEKLLVHGGASGIGTTALLLARAFQAEAIVTAGTDEKCTRLTELGATAAYNHRTQDWEKEITDNGGVDVILDMVGGDYIAKNINCLRAGGRHVSIAFLNGPVGEMNILKIMQGRLKLSGSTLRARSLDEKAQLARQLEEKVWPLMKSDAIKPIIHATFPLEEATKAHQMMEESSHIGKIVLEVG